jgi:glutamate/tyrosine decarboxylase-like PLP-dependent enzyme
MMGDVHNQYEYGFELSRTDRALKVWLALKQYGVDQYAKMIAEHNALARHLACLISELEDFEVVAPPVMSICCFRYVPTDLERGTAESEAYLSRLNTAIEQALVKDGRALVSGTNLSGKRVLRACIVSSAVTRSSISKTVTLLQHYGRTLDAQIRAESL